MIGAALPLGLERQRIGRLEIVGIDLQRAAPVPERRGQVAPPAFGQRQQALNRRAVGRQLRGLRQLLGALFDFLLPQQQQPEVGPSRGLVRHQRDDAIELRARQHLLRRLHRRQAGVERGDRLAIGLGRDVRLAPARRAAGGGDEHGDHRDEEKATGHQGLAGGGQTIVAASSAGEARRCDRAPRVFTLDGRRFFDERRSDRKPRDILPGFRAPSWSAPLDAAKLVHRVSVFCWRSSRPQPWCWCGRPWPRPVFSRPSLFPHPWDVARGIALELRSGRLVNDAIASLFRVSSGFLLAVALGVPAGLVLGHSARARDAFLPIVNFFRSLSPLAWIPFAILWLGIGDPPAIFLIFMAAFFPIVLSTTAAVANIPSVFFRVARDLGHQRRAAARCGHAAGDCAAGDHHAAGDGGPLVAGGGRGGDDCRPRRPGIRGLGRAQRAAHRFAGGRDGRDRRHRRRPRSAARAAHAGFRACAGDTTDDRVRRRFAGAAPAGWRHRGLRHRRACSTASTSRCATASSSRSSARRAAARRRCSTSARDGWRRAPARSIGRRACGWSFSRTVCFPWLTVRENILLGLEQVADPAERKRRSEALLELIGLQAFAVGLSRTSSRAACGSAWSWRAR